MTKKGDIMAKVTVCDRCGKTINIMGARTFTLRRICLAARLFEPGSYESNHDLCPDCALELDIFFEGKATDAVVKE